VISGYPEDTQVCRTAGDKLAATIEKLGTPAFTRA
jgi:hypothetical protein